jgi:hypothetical protein
MTSIPMLFAVAFVSVMACTAGNDGLEPSPADDAIGECDPAMHSDCFEAPSTAELKPPADFPKLLFAATPSKEDASFEDFLARTRLTRRWGDPTDGAAPRYGIATIGKRRALELVARQGTRGASGGFLLPGMAPDGVAGGPRESFGRVKAYWDPNYDYNPRKQDATGAWTVREGAGGCKFAGFWGGDTPATGNAVDAAGWALTIWTGSSSNYVGLGLDLDFPRDDDYANFAIYYGPDENSWRIDKNSGRWVQLEWEHIIESTAGGGDGRVRMWIDGTLGLDEKVRYFDPAQWSADAGLKGFYLRNFWGGVGRAPVDTPMYYADIEIWTR